MQLQQDRCIHKANVHLLYKIHKNVRLIQPVNDKLPPTNLKKVFFYSRKFTPRLEIVSHIDRIM